MLDNIAPHRMGALIEAGRLIVSDLDLDSILQRVVETAAELTGARYVALGVLDGERHELERFITHGIDETTQRQIGALPRGHGVLGVLIEDPRPLRLAAVADHPASYGFPPHHPPMGSFLGVPILIRGLAWGNLYLTEKADGGAFDAADEAAVIVLSGWAAIAVDNARLYQTLQRALDGLRASQAIAVAVGAETDRDRVLALIVQRGRALANARAVVIFLREGDDLVVAASSGDSQAGDGARIPIDGSTSGEVMRSGEAMRIGDVGGRMRISPERFGVTDATSALLVPLIHRGTALGVLAAFDRGDEAARFDEDDEQALKAFGASAATVVAAARSIEMERLASALGAADAERRHWAQELHDETLQALGALRVMLSTALRSTDPQRTSDGVALAIASIEQEIANLRSIINELRPAALDQLGLVPALEALLDRHRTVNDLEIDAVLPDPADAEALAGLGPTIYRVVQEALTNVVKHAGARRVHVAVSASPGGVATLAVSDDGSGFQTAATTSGYGLAGMRERVLLAGGELSVDSHPPGTRIHATMPLDGV